MMRTPTIKKRQQATTKLPFSDHQATILPAACLCCFDDDAHRRFSSSQDDQIFLLCKGGEETRNVLVLVKPHCLVPNEMILDQSCAVRYGEKETNHESSW
jgi:hypothetical protein